MSILNNIKEIVTKGTRVDVNTNVQYDKYDVLVTDITNSVTSGWELLYKVGISKYNQKPFNVFGKYSEVHMKGFSKIYGMLQQCYSAFKQGVNVEKRYDTNFAVYQPDETLWFTALERKAGVSITVTVTDSNSPFHMMYMNFMIVQSTENGQPYLIGYDKMYNQSTDTFVDRMNSFMLPKSERYVPVHRMEDGSHMIKAQGTLTQEGNVRIDESKTEIAFIQEIKDERKLLAGIYETFIIEKMLDAAEKALLSAQQQQPNQTFGQAVQESSKNTPFGAPVFKAKEVDSMLQAQPNQQEAIAVNQPQSGLAPFGQAINVDTSEVF